MTSTNWIRFQMMVLDFKDVSGTAHVYFWTLVRPHGPERAPCSSTSAGRLVPPSLRANKCHSAKSWLFSVLEPQWWNEVPTNVRTAESLSIFNKRLKTHLFGLHLDPSWHESLPPLQKSRNQLYVHIISTSITALLNLKNYGPQMTAWQLFLYFVLLHWWWCHGFSLVTNILIVNVNVNVSTLY